ncbi:IS1634 family transposase [Xylanimonas protaetiae]|uniref:IS1634 family transposase n=1 Tax=Xylanimonas protaetiae TaxID=2509457 RepID=A0A4P6F8W7_9MICO|nr:IS1634 family transposase [Xylanimonas protaetiae]QAY68703.1 IS1634 family transposase [Xylanimonas protaetiae]QAY68743.1 IS1634 family transposase [Xylanimonas protaetiae]QAY69024.1 IS1634 family transposase [Xylanimonas protaetiae]QAY69486.1 IS1634 family transposase [Xylanimonas protaetiae]QAY69757.1 IS1634 family transposase [Xylanimonas protaetiae]
MVWVRRVRTASGATAVQIVESVNGRRRIVRHVGSAHDEVALGLLMDEAADLIKGDQQLELDLGLQAVSRYAPLIPVPQPPALFGQTPSRARGWMPAPLLRRSFSRILYDAIGGVFDELGFDIVGDDTFRDLVIARIVEPTSLLDVDRVLSDLGRVAASLSTRKRTLKRAQDGRYRDLIAKACFTFAQASDDVSLVLYDVTTLYFEAEKEDDLRKVGYSKERRVDPQIVVGLLVDRTGFPLEIGCFEGNKAETLTILPVIKSFQARHGIEGMVIVADAGMLSGANLRELDDAGFSFIVGSRQTTAPLDLASHYRWHGTVFTDGQMIDTITPKHRGATPVNDVNVKAEPVWTKTGTPASWRAVWAYSAKRFARDNRTLTAQEDRARSVIDGDKPARATRFVKTTGTARTLDETALARARKVAGLKGYVTNIPATVMAPGEVISSYHDLWHVEQSFRMSKTDLQARPFFARTRDAIEAHLTIVFTALAVSRTIQDRTGLSIRKVLRELRPLRSATIEINGVIRDAEPAIPADKQAILDAIRKPARH